MDEALQKQLLLQAQVGDQSAMHELYTETRSFAYFAASRYLGGDKDIQPVLKDTYIITFGRLGEIPPGKDFTGWLNYVLAVKCLNYLRGKKVSFTSKEEFNAIPDDRELFPAAWLEQGEKRGDILRLIDTLPPGQKMALLLHYMGGLSLPDMAQCMGVTEIAVSGHLQLGKNALRTATSGGDVAGDGVPALTQLFRVESSAAEMPPPLVKEIYQEMMLFFMGGGKAPKLAVAAGAGSGADGGKSKGYLPWVISLVALALVLVFLFWNFQRTQRKVGGQLVSEYEQSKLLTEAGEQEYQAAAEQQEPPPPPQIDTPPEGAGDTQAAPDENVPPVESAGGEIVQIID